MKATNGKTSITDFTRIPSITKMPSSIYYELIVNQLVIRYKTDVGITNMQIVFADQHSNSWADGGTQDVVRAEDE